MNARKKSLVTLSVSALLVLGATGGGLAYTKVTVDAADRTSPTRVWDAPAKAPSIDDPAADASDGREDNPLSEELLPVPDEYRLGPDIDGLGNDVYLSGKEAEALLRKGSGSLPGDQREQLQKFVKKLEVKGMAMRSYVHYGDGLLIEMKLSQMDNRDAVESLNSFQAGIADAFSVLREGPEIDGYEKAECFLMPEDEDARLEEMFCTAHEDDVLVSLQATATEEGYGGGVDVEKKGAQLLEKQLDRLTEGGGISA